MATVLCDVCDGCITEKCSCPPKWKCRCVKSSSPEPLSQRVPDATPVEALTETQMEQRLYAAVDDFFTLAPQYRTKEKLKEMLRRA